MSMDRVSSFSQEGVSSQLALKVEGSFVSFFEGRRLEIIPTPPSGDSNDVVISVACKIYSFGIHTVLDFFLGNTQESTYIPVQVSLPGKDGLTTIYIKVDSAAKRLFSSSEEIRSQESFQDYLENKTAEVWGQIDRIHSAADSDKVSKSDLYSTAITVQVTALKNVKKGIFQEGDVQKIDRYTVLCQNNKIILIEVEIGKLGKGTFGTVYKVVDVSTGAVNALKRISRRFSSDEPELAREIVNRDKPIFGVQEFIKAPFAVEDLKTGVKVEGSVVRSKLYKSDAFSKVVKRQSAPVKTTIVLQECSRLITGLNNLQKELGRIHIDLKLQNFLCLEDGEMVVADLGDLPKVASKEAWVKAIFQNRLIHAYTARFTPEEEISSLKLFKESIVRVRQEKFNRPPDMVFLKEAISLFGVTISKEERAILEKGRLPQGLEDKFQEAAFKKYQEVSEKIAVFQMGYAFYQLICDNTSPYPRLEDSRHPNLNENQLSNILKELQLKMPDDPLAAKVISDMLHPNPAKRASIEEVRQVLEKYLNFHSS